MEEELAGAVEYGVDHDDAEGPVEEEPAEAVVGLDVGEFAGDGAPEAAADAGGAVEGFELLAVGWRGEPGDEQGGGYGGAGDDEEGDGKECGVAVALEEGVGDEGDDHGGDFGPGVEAPPEPAHDEDESGAGAALEDEFPCSGDGVENEEGDDEGGYGHDYGEDAGDGDVVCFVGVGADEAAPGVVDEVAGAPVEVGGEGRHVGGQKGGDEEAAEPDGEEGLHDVNEAVFFLVGREVGEHDEAGKADDDPGPWPETVVGYGEPEGGEERVFFVFGAHHALGDVAAAAGFGAGVPGGPPLDKGHGGEGEDG